MPLSTPPARLPDVSRSARELDSAGISFEFAPALESIVRPSTPEAVVLQELATQVAQQHLRYGRRGLAICGASYGSGVTVTAACLAGAMAEAGVSTILIEGNLRSPSLQSLIIPSGPVLGLSRYLQGDAERHEVLWPNVRENLTVVFAGDVAPDANELLASRRFRDFLDFATRDFGCLIVDTPPANRYADARTIAAAVGYAAIVARRQFSFVNDAALLARQLEAAGVGIVGSIFNRG